MALESVFEISKEEVADTVGCRHSKTYGKFDELRLQNSVR